MRSSERVPVLNSITNPLASALELAFGCRHSNLSRVFTLRGRSYKVCCDCGATFRYSLRSMSIVSHHPIAIVLRRMRLPHLRRRNTR